MEFLRLDSGLNIIVMELDRTVKSVNLVDHFFHALQKVVLHLWIPSLKQLSKVLGKMIGLIPAMSMVGVYLIPSISDAPKIRKFLLIAHHLHLINVLNNSFREQVMLSSQPSIQIPVGMLDVTRLVDF